MLGTHSTNTHNPRRIEVSMTYISVHKMFLKWLVQTNNKQAKHTFVYNAVPVVSVSLGPASNIPLKLLADKDITVLPTLLSTRAHKNGRLE